MEINNLITRDLKTIWHPCSQMKDYETFAPLIIKHAQGSYLELVDGRKIIDAISSWWCKSLGHNHPYLKQILLQQLEKFEHVILANTTNETIVRLAEQLVALTGLDKVSFASEGSSAIEIAMKISLHVRKIRTEKQRNKFMALTNAYHGETGLALSVSDVGIYRDAYQELLLPVKFIKNIPYVNNRHDVIWKDCQAQWLMIEKELELYADDLTAIIVEPILQGAGGMLLYSQDFLRHLRQWTKKHNIHLIADEIMTGIGRTGLPLACQHAAIKPDFICLGKGLTSGWLPLSATLISNEIYQEFYADYHQNKNFLHSHTHSGNVLAASVALATLQIMAEENIYNKVQQQEDFLQSLMQEISVKTGLLKNVRGIGAMAAADLIVDDPAERKGYAVYRKAVEYGALLRPLGNTIYWLPPLNATKETLEELQQITYKAILAV